MAAKGCSGVHMGEGPEVPENGIQHGAWSALLEAVAARAGRNAGLSALPGGIWNLDVGGETLVEMRPGDTLRLRAEVGAPPPDRGRRTREALLVFNGVLEPGGRIAFTEEEEGEIILVAEIARDGLDADGLESILGAFVATLWRWRVVVSHGIGEVETDARADLRGAGGDGPEDVGYGGMIRV